MSRNLFKCTSDTVRNLYSLFDGLVTKDSNILKDVLNKEEVEVRKDFLGDTFIKLKNSSYKLDKDVLKELNAEATFDEGSDKFIASVFMLRELGFNEGYLYNTSDIVRCSEDYGIVGYRKNYSNVDGIYPPRGVLPFNDVCEVREEYSSLISNGYKKVNLPKEFRGIISNKEYKKFFKSMIAKGYSVNNLFEKRGGVFCRNKVQGYISIDSLKGVEYDFYYELLEGVVSLGKPVHSAYFYSDLNWTCMLYRESKESKGEYDIVLK